jgi:hypothetical protein
VGNAHLISDMAEKLDQALEWNATNPPHSWDLEALETN